MGLLPLLASFKYIASPFTDVIPITWQRDACGSCRVLAGHWGRFARDGLSLAARVRAGRFRKIARCGCCTIPAVADVRQTGEFFTILVAERASAQLRPSSLASSPASHVAAAPQLAKLALVQTLGAFAYFGLAIVGAGGFGRFFSHPSLIVVTVALLGMWAISPFTQGNVSPGVREDRSNRWVLIPFTVIGLLLAYLPAYTDRREFWTFDGDAIRWVGVALFIVGGALRMWPVFVLGRRFSGLVAIQPGHALVTTGIYGVIRHPSYLGLLVRFGGWSLAFRSGVGLLLTALLIPPLLARIRAEESATRIAVRTAAAGATGRARRG